jgi:hypothetical protein
MCHDAIFLG